MQNVTNKKQGFTLIEVVLVLAIAGLIFLIVFLALPALQRSQRDTQRKQDLSRMMSQVTNYSSNNQGSLPADTTAWNSISFKGSYLTNNQTFKDPSTGADYTITQQTPSPPTSTPAPAAGNIWVYVNAKCGGTNGVDVGTGARSIAAVIHQELGGFYCQQN